MLKLKSLKVLLSLLVLISVFLAIPVFGGTGSLRIEPTWPEAQDSPAYFEIWSQPPDTAYDVYVFLTMTEDSYLGLTGDVTVEWTGPSSPLVIGMGEWTLGQDGVKLPTGAPGGVTDGAAFTLASLKDHLGTDDDVYWAFGPILDGPLTGVHQTLTVTINSDDPHMLVYLMAKSDTEGPFDMRIPPTKPGLVVPEVPFGTIAIVGSMMAALILFSKKSF